MLDCTRPRKEGLCPTGRALARNFVDPRDHDNLGEDLQNVVPLRSFNLQYQMAEFEVCLGQDNDDQSRTSQASRSAQYQRRRLFEDVAIDDTGIETGIDEVDEVDLPPISYALSMTHIHELPDPPIGQRIEAADWIAGKDAAFNSQGAAVDGYYVFDFSGLHLNASDDEVQGFMIYEQIHPSAVLSSNGYITFGGNTSDFEGTLDSAFSRRLPRVSAFNTDLMPENPPSGAGTAVMLQKIANHTDPTKSRVVISFTNVPLDPKSARTDGGGPSIDDQLSTFQVALFPVTGTIRLAWLDAANMTTTAVGVTPPSRPEKFREHAFQDAGCVYNPMCISEDETRPIGPTRPKDASVYIYGIHFTEELGLTKPHPYAIAEYPNPHPQFCQAGCTFYYTAQNWISYTFGYGDLEKSQRAYSNADYDEAYTGDGQPTSSPTTSQPTFKPTHEPTVEDIVPTPMPTSALEKNTLRLCLERCDHTYQYDITVGYSDVAEVARLECWDGCQIANLRCQPGYYCYLGMMRACPVGTYRHNDISHVEDCFPCPKGRYRDREGGRSDMDCDFCPVGKYINDVGSNSVSDCNRCPAGRFGVEPGVAECECISKDSCFSRDSPDGVATLTEAEYDVRKEYHEDLRELRDTVPFIGRF